MLLCCTPSIPLFGKEGQGEILKITSIPIFFQEPPVYSQIPLYQKISGLSSQCPSYIYPSPYLSLFLRTVMLSSVKFYDEFCLWAIEINNRVVAYCLLPVKLVSLQLFSSYLLPQSQLQSCL